MPSRNLNDLAPDVHARAAEFLDRCHEAGHDVIVTCTYRSAADQDALYAQGRTAPGRIVTHLRGGQSMHNVTDKSGAPASRALDIVPLRHGKVVWGTAGNGLDQDPTDDDRDDLELWQRIGAIGEAYGLEWGGRWPRFKDMPHFQVRMR